MPSSSRATALILALGVWNFLGVAEALEEVEEGGGDGSAFRAIGSSASESEDSNSYYLSSSLSFSLPNSYP